MNKQYDFEGESEEQPPFLRVQRGKATPAVSPNIKLTSTFGLVGQEASNNKPVIICIVVLVICLLWSIIENFVFIDKQPTDDDNKRINAINVFLIIVNVISIILVGNYDQSKHVWVGVLMYMLYAISILNSILLIFRGSEPCDNPDAEVVADASEDTWMVGIGSVLSVVSFLLCMCVIYLYKDEGPSPRNWYWVAVGAGCVVIIGLYIVMFKMYKCNSCPRRPRFLNMGGCTEDGPDKTLMMLIPAIIFIGLFVGSWMVMGNVD